MLKHYEESADIREMAEKLKEKLGQMKHEQRQFHTATRKQKNSSADKPKDLLSGGQLWNMWAKVERHPGEPKHCVFSK